MAPNLSTTYLGLPLANPLIVGSCSLTGNLDWIRRFSDGGAGAIVLKSLFEEQIDTDVQVIENHLWMQGHAESHQYVRSMGMELGANSYIHLLEEAKKIASCPIIASINCVTPKWWSAYARKLADAGADALELNISMLPTDPDRTSQDVEERIMDIVESVNRDVSIPLAVKVGPFFTAFSRIANELVLRGASGLVLFNRFYHMDLDPDSLKIRARNPLSSPEESHLPLRWIALLYDHIEADLCASTGIHDAMAAIKMILAGASAVQMCSVLYHREEGVLREIQEGMETWMKEKGYSSLEDFQGLACQSRSRHPEAYERLQYIRALTGIE
ncbi:MAG TPA: dihydroorotate dehydrogenase-like protein [Thermoanaerobaculia bacterium]|nr:dihydroorotate dehydrogenase-like protein [Thermoanaerobaculia bacterium]HUM28972.1 dihydroorotate dehydrogenase-like protein [Thermoanaerobaculia bacterium]HXK67096.1 dihydroorotate dehydrogenase-like protein [Thermoanaerobaculia bacterium]